MAPRNVAVDSEHYYEFEGQRGKLRITIPFTNSNNYPEAAGISVTYIEGPSEGLNQHFTPQMWNRVILSENPIGNAASGGKRRKSRKSRKAKHTKKRMTRRR